MNSEIRNQQNHFHKHSDWLAQVNNVNDTEASQVNGGMMATLPPKNAGTAGTSSSDLVGDVSASFEEAFATQVDLEEAYLQYSTRSEALRAISEAVQKSIDISENERQDISQSQA